MANVSGDTFGITAHDGERIGGYVRGHRVWWREYPGIRSGSPRTTARVAVRGGGALRCGARRGRALRTQQSTARFAVPRHCIGPTLDLPRRSGSVRWPRCAIRTDPTSRVRPDRKVLLCAVMIGCAESPPIAATAGRRRGDAVAHKLRRANRRDRSGAGGAKSPRIARDEALCAARTSTSQTPQRRRARARRATYASTRGAASRSAARPLALPLDRRRRRGPRGGLRTSRPIDRCPATARRARRRARRRRGTRAAPARATIARRVVAHPTNRPEPRRRAPVAATRCPARGRGRRRTAARARGATRATTDRARTVPAAR